MFYMINIIHVIFFPTIVAEDCYLFLWFVYRMPRTKDHALHHECMCEAESELTNLVQRPNSSVGFPGAVWHHIAR